MSFDQRPGAARAIRSSPVPTAPAAAPPTDTATEEADNGSGMRLSLPGIALFLLAALFSGAGVVLVMAR